MSMRLLNLMALAVLALLVLLNSVAVVPAGERGVFSRFGEITAIGLPPGLYFRVPLVDRMEVVDMRTRLSDLGRDEYLDADRNSMLAEAWVLWRIRDLPRYYLATSADADRAGAALLPVVQEQLRQAFAGMEWTQSHGGLPPAVRQHLIAASNARLRRELGVELVDVRVRHLAFTPSVQDLVLQRMQVERESAAAAIRAETEQQVAEIKAAGIRAQEDLRGETRLQADKRREEGKVESAAILAQAQAQEPGFFRYWQALETWRQGFGKPGDILVLGKDSQLQAYLKQFHLDKPAEPATGAAP